MSNIFKNIFTARNLLTTLKGMVVGLVFGIVWFVGAALGGLVSLGSNFFGAILIIALFIMALFLWGYLARTFWGWK